MIRSSIRRLCLPLFALALAAGDARPATALEPDACQTLQIKKRSLDFPALAQALERGPEWATANLKPEEMDKLREFLTVEEQLMFQCRGGGRRRPASTATSPSVAPLPTRKPTSPGGPPPAVPAEVAVPAEAPAAAEVSPPPPVPEPAAPTNAAATVIVPPPAAAEPAPPPARPDVTAEPVPATIPAAATIDTENTLAPEREPETGGVEEQRSPAAPKPSGQAAPARVKPGERPPFRARVEP